MPKVSVIIPNYNHARYLRRRIDSVLNQTCQDFELIILDDCSTDESRDIIETYRSHPKLAAIEYNQANSGSTFKQWNKGIGIAKGTFIWIAESDDHCELSLLETNLQNIEANTNTGIAFVQSMEVDESANKQFLSFHDHPRFAHSFAKSYFNTGSNEIAQRLVYENTIPNASAVLFRKETYLACGGADESMRLCGDWLLWVKMLTISNVYFDAEPLNYFRLTAASVRQKQGRINTLRERLQVLKFIDDFNHVKAVDESQFKLIREVLNSCRVSELNKAWNYVLSNKKFLRNPYATTFKSFAWSFWDRLSRKW